MMENSQKIEEILKKVANILINLHKLYNQMDACIVAINNSIVINNVDTITKFYESTTPYNRNWKKLVVEINDQLEELYGAIKSI